VYAFFALPLLVYTTVGAFVASRRPKNPIGWMLCAIGFVFAVEGFGVAYADYDLLAQADPSLPGGVFMACISQNLLMLPALALTAILLVLLFPDGRLPGRSWRAVPWVATGGGVLWTLCLATGDKYLERYSLRNPLWVGGAIGDFFDGLGRLGAVALLVMFVAAVISMFVRLQNADPTEHQQIKWFAYAAVVLFTVSLCWPTLNWLSAWFWFPLGVADLAVIPVAVGMAILKYHLYDIDRIINRTLVYGSLTLMLALLYFGGVTGTQAVFQTLTGQQKLPQLGVVASTLVIAALFNPLNAWCEL
jgi:hypothetical protein